MSGPSSARFWSVTLGGTHALWLAHIERVTAVDAQREYEYWRALLGDAVVLDILDGGADVMTAKIACAIQNLCKDGAGVTPAQIIGLGFAPEAVAAHFTAAAQLVAASMPQHPADLMPPNVIRFPRGGSR